MKCGPEKFIPGLPAEAAAGLAPAHVAAPVNLAGCLPLPGSQMHCVRDLACVPWGAQVLGEGQCHLAPGVQKIQMEGELEGWGAEAAAGMVHPARKEAQSKGHC